MGKENTNANDNIQDNNDNNLDNSSNNNVDNSGQEQETVDAAAFADLISAKDKELEEMRNEIKSLKKTNAEMLVKISAGAKETEDIGKSIVEMFDTRKF